MKGMNALDELSTNALMNKRKSTAHQLVIKKMMYLNRSVHSFLIESSVPAARDLLISTALSSALEVIFNPKIDLDASRFAFGVILAVFEASFGAEKKFVPESEDIYVIICRLLPTLCDAFNIYFEFCKSKKLLKPKRTFTQVFPSSYPFEEHFIDSNVEDV
ncbi:unnamed protein product [Ambrosiozyma monospora]|uniref:Unnamed protein product n=1 Tax=Ambrosiozyma monospora TaxID=43982 RepID=A0ACB5U7S9_AMBMO|nr:unnamed protein product [Ambrosiozyma monospora]